MPNANIAKTKKNVKKKKYSQVVNILKKLVGATTITKQILNLGVSFIVGKLLAFALAIEKQLTKPIFKDEAIQFHVNTLD